jgi:hypothetical protein
MRTLEAIMFDFERAPHAELVISGLDGLRLDMLATLVNRET